MPAPEALARQDIDDLLQACGWAVQDRREADLGASLGVAIRELPTDAGPADYLLFADRKMIGVVEANPAGTTLSGVFDQSSSYIAGVSGHTAKWRDPLPFSYESTGVETFFTSGLDPFPRARRVFSFHRPETLIEWAKETESPPRPPTQAGLRGQAGASGSQRRARLRPSRSYPQGERLHLCSVPSNPPEAEQVATIACALP